MKIKILSLALICVAAAASATTWFPDEVECPLCGKTNEFQVVGSYGTYIYNWPSKYELIFWPDTESQTLYSCEKCKYTCFSYDFRDPPEDKLDALREAAKEVEFAGKYKDYDDIPIMDRLAAAERIYRVMYPDDTDFWCRFYRIVGYHAANYGLTDEAAEARRRALDVAEGMMEDESRAGEHKQFLYITGAMRYLLDDKEGARADFEAAQELTFEHADLEAERNQGYDEYLSTLLEDYLAKLDGNE
ncbi:MAG: hypothetical protein PVH29_14715 [Candidatus Zixiibacteriota bacterium]